MRTIRVLLASCLTAFLLHAAPATAAPCAGFDDVDSLNSFCGAVAWMKNRSVTVGCTPNLYCPDANVSRLQMAAFISRLQKVLPPTWVDANGVAIGAHMTNKNGPDAYVVRRAPGGIVVALGISTSTFDFVRTTVYFEQPVCAGPVYAALTGAFPLEIHRFGLVNGTSIYVSPFPAPSAGSLLIPQSERTPAGACVSTKVLKEVIPMIFAEDLGATPLVAPFRLE